MLAGALLLKGAKISTPQKCVEHHALCEDQVHTFESCYYAELAFEKVKQTITQIYAMLEYLLNGMNAIKRLGL